MRREERKKTFARLPSRALPRAGNDSHADCRPRVLGDAAAEPANETPTMKDDRSTHVAARALST